MCKMSFMVSDKGHVTGLDSAMFNAWKKQNEDGVGVVFRDKNNMIHINRYVTSKSYKTIKHAYDRLLFHIRYGTGAKGTHPFSCSHAPNWHVIHNGSLIAKGKFRKTLGRKGHEYLTGIDSENFAHIWGDIYDENENIGDLAVKMMKKVHGIPGKKDVILYNHVTDEWVLISNGRLEQIKTDGFILVASNFDFFPKLKPTPIASGTIIYGKGTKILGEREWDGTQFVLEKFNFAKRFNFTKKINQKTLDEDFDEGSDEEFDEDDEEFDEDYSKWNKIPKNISKNCIKEESYSLSNDEDSFNW